MSACAKCGGSLSNPFDFSDIEATSCQCNTGGLVLESNALPNQTCCVVEVNGKTGKVALTIDDIPLEGEVFFTDALAIAAFTPVAPIGLDGSGNLTHDDSLVTPGTYGSSTEVPMITVDVKGHVTNVANVAMATPAIGDDLTAIEALTGTGYLIRTGVNTWALKTIGSSATITVNNGDGVSAPTTMDLVETGVIAGDYGGPLSWPVFTIDAYGRITTATSIALPAVVIPAHTHALGDLSTSGASIASPTTNDTIYWSGTEWIAGPTSTVIDSDSLTPAANVLVATSSLDIDSAELGQPINTIYRFKDVNDKYKVSISAILYIPEADLPSDPGATQIYGFHIATVPAGYEPIHPICISVPPSITPTDIGLENFDGTVAFAGVQFAATMSIIINPNGQILLNFSGSSAYTSATLGAVDNAIFSITLEYLTKAIVP